MSRRSKTPVSLPFVGQSMPPKKPKRTDRASAPPRSITILEDFDNDTCSTTLGGYSEFESVVSAGRRSRTDRSSTVPPPQQRSSSGSSSVVKKITKKALLEDDDGSDGSDLEEALQKLQGELLLRRQRLEELGGENGEAEDLKYHHFISKPMDWNTSSSLTNTTHASSSRGSEESSSHFGKTYLKRENAESVSLRLLSPEEDHSVLEIMEKVSNMALDKDLSQLQQQKANLQRKMRGLEQMESLMQQDTEGGLEESDDVQDPTIKVHRPVISEFSDSLLASDDTSLLLAVKAREARAARATKQRRFLSQLVNDIPGIQLESVGNSDETDESSDLLYVKLLISINHRLCLVLHNQDDEAPTFFRLVNAFFLPPLAVSRKDGPPLDMPPLDDLICFHSTDDDNSLTGFLITLLQRLELWMDRQSHLDFLRHHHDCHVKICLSGTDHQSVQESLLFPRVSCQFALVSDPDVVITAMLRLTPNCPRVPGSVFLESLKCTACSCSLPQSSSRQHYCATQVKHAAAHAQRRQLRYKSPVALIVDVQDYLNQVFQDRPKSNPHLDKFFA